MMEPSKVNLEKIERHKSAHEYFKYLTSLSTGSIVILTTFLDKTLQSQEWKALIIFSLIGFLLTVICSVLAYTLYLFDFPGRKSKSKDWENIVGGFSLMIAWFSFVVGVSSLSIFAIKNII